MRDGDVAGPAIRGRILSCVEARQAIHDPSAPSLILLLGKDGATDRPIQLDELRIDRALRPPLRVTDAPFERAEQLGVTIRESNTAASHS